MFDMDEGVYLGAARAVADGKALYTDFFYTQLMLMPTVFAPLATQGWTSFWILRGLAVAFGFLSAVLLFIIVLKTSRDYKSALIALFLYCFSGMILSWHTVFKAHVFSHFLSLGTFFFWLLYYEKKKIIYLIFTGLFLSAVINHRAVFIVLLPLYLVSVWYLAEGGRVRNMIIFLLSMIPFALPTVIKIFSDADHFFFDTFIFQLNRTGDQSWQFLINNKLLTIAKTVIDPHLLIIFILCIISLRLLRKRGRLNNIKSIFITPQGMVLMNLVLIAGIHVFPNPMMPQYVEQFMAFGIILISFSLPDIIGNFESAVRSKLRYVIYIIIILIYLGSLTPYIALYLLEFRESGKMYSLAEVRKITNKMLELADRSDIVMSEWAGYPFLTGQKVLPYTEILGFEHPLPINHEGYMKYRLADNIYLREHIVKETPALVIIVNKPPDAYAGDLSAGYLKAFQSDRVSIYKTR